MGKKNIFDKIAENSYGMVFGILSGSGLFFLSGAVASLVVSLILNLDKYFLIIYVAIHLFTLIGTAKMYTKGLFRMVYVGSSLILLITYLSIKI